MEIKISRAKKKDFPYIQQKIKKYLLDSTNIDWRQFFAARVKDKTVAFGRIIDHGDFFEIASLGVDYYHRKQGIGKIMLDFLTRQARRQNARKPIYGVTHVVPFVVSCGFTQIDSGYPAYLDYKRKHICQLDESLIKIMKWRDGAAAFG